MKSSQRENERERERERNMNICHFYGTWEARSDRQCHLVNCTHQRRDVIVNVIFSGKICIFNKTSQGNNKYIFGIPEAWEIRIWANKNKTRGLKLCRASWVKIVQMYRKNLACVLRPSRKPDHTGSAYYLFQNLQEPRDELCWMCKKV